MKYDKKAKLHRAKSGKGMGLVESFSALRLFMKAIHSVEKLTLMLLYRKFPWRSVTFSKVAD